MAGTNQIPERLINFRVYRDGNDLLGAANVTLPNLEAMSDTTSGAGIAGEVETPVLGHYGSMTVTIQWRVIYGDVTKLARQESHALDIRGSIQVMDASLGKLVTVPVKLVLRAMPKNVTLGSFEVGATTDTETELEVTYLKLDINGETKVEIDKYNFISRFDGEDALETVRKDLGIG